MTREEALRKIRAGAKVRVLGGNTASCSYVWVGTTVYGIQGPYPTEQAQSLALALQTEAAERAKPREATEGHEGYA